MKCHIEERPPAVVKKVAILELTQEEVTAFNTWYERSDIYKMPAQQRGAAKVVGDIYSTLPLNDMTQLTDEGR